MKIVCLNRGVLESLCNTAFPGLEQVAHGSLGDGLDYYWALTGDGVDGSEGPVWVMPARKAYGLPFLEKWYPATTSSWWHELAQAYAAGRLNEYAGTFLLRMPPPPRAHWESLGWHSSIPPVLVGYAGALNPWQKVVAGLIQRETGIAAMVAKFPMSDEARTYIDKEAETLDLLQREMPGAGPRPILFDEDRGILVEQALSGESAGKLLQPLHLPFLLRLAQKGETTTLQRRAKALKERLGRIENPDEETTALIDGLCTLLDDATPLPAMWVHGDLHAGNMILRKQGVVQAMDWAFARRHGLPFYDIVRAQVQSKLGREGETIDLPEPDEAHQAYARALDVDLTLYHKVVAYYTARHMLGRYRSGDIQEADRVRVKLGNWMTSSRLARSNAAVL